MSEQEMRELDCFIADKVMGWKRNRYIDPMPENGEYFFSFNPTKESKVVCAFSLFGPPRMSYFEPTTEPAAAMMVLDKILAKCGMDGISINSGVWGFDIELCANTDVSLTAPTLPLAICKFARALFGKDGE